MFGPTVGKSKCSDALSEMSYFYGLKKPGTFGIPNRILRDADIGLFKKGTAMGTRGRMESLYVLRDRAPWYGSDGIFLHQMHTGSGACKASSSPSYTYKYISILIPIVYVVYKYTYTYSIYSI